MSPLLAMITWLVWVLQEEADQRRSGSSWHAPCKRTTRPLLCGTPEAYRRYFFEAGSDMYRGLAAPPKTGGSIQSAFRALRQTGLGEVVLLVLSLRLAWGLFAALALTMHPTSYAGGDWGELAVKPGDNSYYLIAPWQRWDALWYQKIAVEGYWGTPATTAFFPLFPMAMRLTGLAMGGNVALGGLALATAASIAGLTILRRAVAIEFGADVANRTVWYMVAFPTAFFLLAPYTESLFLLLAVIVMGCARKGCWWVAGVAGLLAGLTRAQGALLVAPMLYELVRQWQTLGRNRMTGALATLLPPLGSLLFMAFAAWSTGGRSAGDQLQGYWGYQVVAPWQAASASWGHIGSKGDVAEGINLAALLGFCLATCLMVKRVPFSYVLYVAPHLVLLATRQMWFSPLMSTSRYVLPLFPAFILLALYSKPVWLQRLITLGFILLQALLFNEYIHAGFVA